MIFPDAGAGTYNGVQHECLIIKKRGTAGWHAAYTETAEGTFGVEQPETTPCPGEDVDRFIDSIENT
jgi:hypothetical protein